MLRSGSARKPPVAAAGLLRRPTMTTPRRDGIKTDGKEDCEDNREEGGQEIREQGSCKGKDFREEDRNGDSAEGWCGRACDIARLCALRHQPFHRSPALFC